MTAVEAGVGERQEGSLSSPAHSYPHSPFHRTPVPRFVFTCVDVPRVPPPPRSGLHTSPTPSTVPDTQQAFKELSSDGDSVEIPKGRSLQEREQ